MYECKHQSSEYIRVNPSKCVNRLICVYNECSGRCGIEATINRTRLTSFKRKS